MSVLISHPTGNANVRNALHALKESGLLGRFVTTVAVFEKNIFGRIQHLGFAGELKRRVYDESLHGLTTTYPSRELARIVSSKIGMGSCQKSERSPISTMGVYRYIDRMASRLVRKDPDLNAVFAYEDGALATLLAAKKLGYTSYYELPTTYWRKTREILFEEAQLQADWAATIPALNESEDKLSRKDDELRQADHILCASQFCADSLKNADFPISSPTVIPYGCPPITKQSLSAASDPSVKLKVLFVGNLSQGKGLSYLFEAAKQLGEIAEFTIIGNRFANCPRLDKELSRHKWLGTMPQTEVLKQMQQHDLLVFPSLLEGFGMVISEALSQGLAVITTAHTSAPDLIEDEVSGYIVPIRDSEAIIERINKLNDDRELLFSMKQAALEVARRNPWELYRERLIDYIHATLPKNK